VASTSPKSNTYLRLVLASPYSLLGLTIKKMKLNGKVKEEPPTYTPYLERNNCSCFSSF